MVFFLLTLLYVSYSVSLAATCPYLTGNNVISTSTKGTPVTQTNIPKCIKTNGQALARSDYSTCVVYKNIKSEFSAFLPSNMAARTDILAKALRLAFHDSAEFDQRTYDILGPDGCLSNDESNNGMIEEDSIVMTLFEPLWQKYCDQMSRADFYAIIGALAVEIADPTNTISITKKWGRVDANSCSTKGRLPDALKGLNMIQSIFVDQLGLTMNDAITLIGGHTIGHVHPQFSGYGLPINISDINVNAWDMTPHLFDNLYYRSMILIGWGAVANYLVNPDVTDKSNTLWLDLVNPNIALNSDMAIAFDMSFDYYGRSMPDGFYNLATAGQVCAAIDVTTNTPIIVELNATVPRGCYAVTHGPPNVEFFYLGGEAPTYCLVAHYANDNNAFLQAFAASYDKLTSVGYGPYGKLGPSLKTICTDIC